MDAARGLPPEIDYLSKDYASFRQLMLDHLALRVPTWREQSEADVGIALVELLAYAADYLSYYQDAVGTEAYLGTARRRPSIKRHVRLLDYTLGEGCNARAWVQVQVSDPVVLPKATQVMTRVHTLADTPVLPPHSWAYTQALQAGPKVFETLHAARLVPAQNEVALYAEQDQEAELPAGCVAAVLCEPQEQPGLQMRAGDVLVFEEVKNILTGERKGADPARRHAVRLTAVSKSRRGGREVVEVQWAREDALPVPIRLAVRRNGDVLGGIAIARGNLVLADHGLSVRHERLPVVPPGQRYRPRLALPGLTHALPYVHEMALKQPASAALAQDANLPTPTRPAIALFQRSLAEPLRLDAQFMDEFQNMEMSKTLRQYLLENKVMLSQQVTIRAIHDIGWELYDTLKNRYWLVERESQTLTLISFKRWNLQSDLLSSASLSYDFTVDMEDDRSAILRFGFGQQGKQPSPGDGFRVTYRVGGGEAGNVRAESLYHIVTAFPQVTGVTNPLAAQGGSEPQAIENVRLDAPTAFRLQQRCVTEDDYAAVTMRHPQINAAVARLQWTGSWPTAFIYAQRRAGQALDAQFVAELAQFMEAFRLMEHVIEIHEPYFVGLRLGLKVTVQPRTPQSTVLRALDRAFSNGNDGFFFPDNFIFGQWVYQSQVIAWAMAVPGVMLVEAQQFCRYDAAGCLKQIEIQPLEIARLDNDPAAPYNGIIKFQLEGGV
jgi:hypothetical protein